MNLKLLIGPAPDSSYLNASKKGVSLWRESNVRTFQIIYN